MFHSRRKCGEFAGPSRRQWYYDHYGVLVLLAGERRRGRRELQRAARRRARRLRDYDYLYYLDYPGPEHDYDGYNVLDFLAADFGRSYNAGPNYDDITVYNGFPVVRDPDCPPGYVYLFSDADYSILGADGRKRTARFHRIESCSPDRWTWTGDSAAGVHSPGVEESSTP